MSMELSQQQLQLQCERLGHVAHIVGPSAAELEDSRANTRFLFESVIVVFGMFRLMLVNITTLLLQFEKCIVDDICDGGINLVLS